MKEVENKLLYYFVIFIIGAVIGYIYELLFYKYTLGIWNNWGVLYGPWLPIYGIGSILLSFLKPIKRYPLVVFISSVIVTGIVEFLVGSISINLFNYRLWDYNGLFLNIKGLVCLRSVLSFSIGSMFLIYFIIPIVDNIYIKSKLLKYACIIVFIIFVIDLIVSCLFRNPYTF